MHSLLKQPLLHFLLLGLLLFVAYAAINGKQQNDPYLINVNDQALLDYVQYRNRAFNNDAAHDFMINLTLVQRSALAERLVREDVLYREALAMGLAQDDYVIKQRLVQKMEYLSRGFGTQTTQLSDAELQDYYQAQQHRYQTPASISFSHIFFEKDTVDATETKRLLTQLNHDKTPFNAATGLGQRFIYHTNYIDRDPSYIASHFDQGFANAIFNLRANTQQWQGPLSSQYGTHLVMVIKNTPSHLPPLADIKDPVQADALQAYRDKQTEAAIQTMISRYQIKRDSRYLPTSPTANSADK